MKPYDFMDEMMSKKQMTASWAFWNLDAPNAADEEASQIPSLSVSEEPKDDHEDVCIFCELKGLQEGYENLSAEVYDLRNSIDHLIKMLGGK